MEINELKKLRKQLPHGAIIKISETAKVTSSTVSRFFRGLYCQKNTDIMKAIGIVLAEYRVKEKEAKAILHEAEFSETPENLVARLDMQREKYGQNGSPLL